MIFRGYSGNPYTAPMSIASPRSSRPCPSAGPGRTAGFGFFGPTGRIAAGVAVAGALLLAACAQPFGAPVDATPVWDSRAREWLSADRLADRLGRTPVVLVGEYHDSAEHHRLQRWLLGAMLVRGAHPALLLEQFDLEHQAEIDRARREIDAPPGRTLAPDRVAGAAERVGTAGRFDRRGWNWTFYAPLIADALGAGLPIRAANLSREVAREVVRSGFGALGETRARALRLRPPEATDEAMAREIVAAHCDAIPLATAHGMVRAQQARDAIMADVIANNAGAGAVLIAGNGHVRRDIGVPRYLDPALVARTVVIGLIESTSPDRAPEDALAARFDYIIATPARARDDPCAGFKMPGSASVPGQKIP